MPYKIRQLLTTLITSIKKFGTCRDPIRSQATNLFEIEKKIRYFSHEGHKEVEGWLSAHTLSFVHYLAQFQTRSNISGNVVEIGVYHGRFFIALCLLLQKGETALAIDVFEQQEFNLDGAGKGDYEIFADNLTKHLGHTEMLEILQGDSLKVSPTQLLNKLGQTKARLFSVDGCHTIEHTRNDLVLASQTIVPGGIIIVDDIENPAWPGVLEGTKLFLQGVPNITPIAIAYNKLYLTTTAFKDVYSNFIEQLVAEQTDRLETVDIYGNSVLRVLMPTPESLYPSKYIKVINFSSRNKPDSFLSYGWSTPEPWGVWSVGNRAEIKVNLPEYIAKNITLMVSFHGFVTEKNPSLKVGIKVDSGPVETITFNLGQEYINWKFHLPDRKGSNLSQMTISFSITNPISPQELGLSEDRRCLGIGLRAIYFYS